MASNRHLGRIVALQTLYEHEFRKEVGDSDVDYKTILKRNLAEYKSSVDDIEFIDNLISGILSTQSQLDENCLLYTSPSPRDRSVSRMPSSA